MTPNFYDSSNDDKSIKFKSDDDKVIYSVHQAPDFEFINNPLQELEGSFTKVMYEARRDDFFQDLVFGLIVSKKPKRN